MPALQADNARHRARGHATATTLHVLGQIAAALAFGLALATSPARAEDQASATDWTEISGSAARLLAAGPDRGGQGDLLAGVEIRLDPKTITYWRTPGDAGLPPNFDTAGSDNVAEARVDYPAPSRLDEAGSEAFGYTDEVVFPIHVKRRDPTRPATLALKLDYGVCAAQCLPARATLRLPLADRTTPVSELVEAALARVPVKSAPGGAGTPAILRASGEADGSAVTISARAADSAQVFVEAPADWYFEVGTPQRAQDGTLRFPVKVAQKPEGGRLPGLRVTLTLVDAVKAIEVDTAIERVAPAP